MEFVTDLDFSTLYPKWFSDMTLSPLEKMICMYNEAKKYKNEHI